MIKFFYWIARNKKATRFKNIDAQGNLIPSNRSLKTFLSWKLRLNEYAHTKKILWSPRNEQPKFPKPPSTSKDLRITFISHATFLIQLEGINIITDPVFSQYAGPFGRFGAKRFMQPGVPLSDLPKIDYVLVTHNHFDHMDVPSLKKLRNMSDPTIITGTNNSHYMGNFSNKIVELGWGEHHASDNIRIHYLRAQHWSSRFIIDRNYALWGSFVIEAGKRKIYFSGDTAFSDHFQEAVERFGSFDVSVLPIGGYKPRDFMIEAHNNPEEAVLAHLILQSKQSIASHFGTFNLSDEAKDEPIKDLNKALIKHQLDQTSFKILQAGEHVLFDSNKL